MKTKIFTLALALAAATTANAIPAQRGIWRTMKLANGTEIKVELRGDEFMHYWQDASVIRRFEKLECRKDYDTVILDTSKDKEWELP